MLVEDGGGGLPTVSGTSYTIKQLPVAPIAVGGLSAQQIEAYFSSLEPGAVAAAGAAHTRAAQVLADVANSMVDHVTKLTANWSGSAAESAVSAFSKAHASATTLANASAQTGAVLSWLGNDVFPQYVNYKAPSNGILADAKSLLGMGNQQNEDAQAKMNELNAQLVEANGRLPASISVTMPKVTGAASPSNSSNAGGSANAGGTAGQLGGVATGGGGGGGLSGGGGSGGRGSGGVGPVPTVGGSGGGHLQTGGTAPAPVRLSSVPGGGSGPGLTSGAGGAPGSGSGLPGSVGSGPGGSLGTGPGSVGGVSPISTMPGSTGPVTTESGVPGDDGFPGTGVPGGEPGVTPPGMLGDGGAPGDGPGVGGDLPGMPVSGFPGGGAPAENGFGPGTSGGFSSGLGDDLGEGLPGDGAVVGPDGMIGSFPGVGPDGSFPGGVADGGVPGGGFADGNAAAGGVDGTAADGTGADGFPMMGGGAGGSRDQAERYRQAWMNEDADLWDGGAHAVPSMISR